MRDKKQHFVRSRLAFEPDWWSFLFVHSDIALRFSFISLGVSYRVFIMNPIRVTFVTFDAPCLKRYKYH